MREADSLAQTRSSQPTEARSPQRVVKAPSPHENKSEDWSASRESSEESQNHGCDSLCKRSWLVHKTCRRKANCVTLTCSKFSVPQPLCQQPLSALIFQLSAWLRSIMIYKQLLDAWPSKDEERGSREARASGWSQSEIHRERGAQRNRKEQSQGILSWSCIWGVWVELRWSVH